MDCAAAKPRLSPLLDDALPAPEAQAVRAHLRFCAACTAALDALAGVGRALKAAPAQPLPEGFRRRLEERRAQDAAAGPSWSESMRPLPAAVSLAACALLLVYVKTRHPVQEQAALAEARSDDALRAQLRRDPRLPPLPATAVPEAVPSAAPGVAPAPAGFSNDSQQALFAQEQDRLGIQTLDARGAPAAPAQPQFQGHIGDPVNRPVVDSLVQELAETSRQIREASNMPEVPIAGRTVPVLAKDDDGAGQAAGAAQAALVSDWDGRYSSVPAGTRTVAAAHDWNMLWPRLSADPVPPVDFSKREVVGVFLGPQPTGGYAVSIVGAVTTPTALVVQYTVTQPVPGHQPPDGATAPYALKAVPRVDLPVRFQKVR